MAVNQFAKITPYVDRDGMLYELNNDGTPILDTQIRTRKLKNGEMGVIYETNEIALQTKDGLDILTTESDDMAHGLYKTLVDDEGTDNISVDGESHRILFNNKKIENLPYIITKFTCKVNNPISSDKGMSGEIRIYTYDKDSTDDNKFKNVMSVKYNNALSTTEFPIGFSCENIFNNFKGIVCYGVYVYDGNDYIEDTNAIVNMDAFMEYVLML